MDEMDEYMIATVPVFETSISEKRQSKLQSFCQPF
jgi:hypothetical protein